MKEMNREIVAQIAISWYFFVVGATAGNWAAILPQVEIVRKINHDTLGNVLFAAAVGALTSVWVVSWCSRVIGSAKSCLIGTVFLAVLSPIIGVESNLLFFVFGVFLFGFGLLFADASMNSQAVLLEKVMEKPIIGYFHAIYAIGALFGGMIGGIFMEFKYTLLHEFLIFGAAVIIPNIFFSFFIYDFTEELIINSDEITELGASKLFGHHVETVDMSHLSSEIIAFDSLSASGDENGDGDLEMMVRRHTSGHNDNSYFPVSTQTDSELDEQADMSSKKASPILEPDTSTFVKVCLLCFVAYFGEGSIGDWSGIYLSSYWSCSPFYATLGFVSCQTFIAGGRYMSDYAVLVWGRRNLLTGAGFIAALGLFVAVVASFFPPSALTLLVAITGFSLCGMGMSVVAPSVISMAGNIEGYNASDGVAYATAVGYMGVLIGPPFLGNLAIWLGNLRWSFLVDSILLLTISWIGWSIPKHFAFAFSE